MVKPLSFEMTEKSTKMDKMSNTGSGGGSGSGSGSNTKPVPMRLFAAWEVDRTPPNCIPRLCSLTITRLSLLTPLPTDMSSLSLAVKMQSSKRTLRSHEIPVPQQTSTNSSTPTITTTSVTSTTSATLSSGAIQSSISNNLQGSGGGGSFTNQGYNSIQQQQQQQNQQNFHSGIGDGNTLNNIMGNINTHTNVTGIGASINLNTTSIGGSAGGNILNSQSGQGNMSGNNSTSTSTIPAPLLETDLDLHFSLQYPHFIKRDGNRLVILLQRRKKYKSRTILGYKTLAEGVVRMDAVLQKSMDMAVELMATGKSGRPGTTVAILRAERVSSIPVDHDNKNNNSVSITDRVNEYSDDEEEGEFSSAEDNEDAIDVGYEGGNVVGTNNKRDYSTTKHDMRKYRKLQRSSNNPEGDGDVDGVGNLGTNQGDSDSEFEMKDKGLSRAKISRTISLQQRNFKQKIVALLKRFKATEELDDGVNRGTAALRGERELDALFQELESLSCGEGDDSGPDLDSLSINSTPKPSLRPFFTNSRSMLHDNITSNITGKVGRRSSDKSDNVTNDKKNNSATTPDRNDSSGNEGYTGNTDPEGQNSDPQNAGSPPREKELHHQQQLQQHQQHQQMLQQQQQTPVTNEKRSRLFRTSSNTPGSGSKKKQSLSLSAEPKSVLETCLSPTNVEPRKLLLDQLSKVFSVDEALLPDVVTIISPPEACGSHLAARLNPIFTQTFRPAFIPQNTAEVRAVLQALMNKIQKYCNSNAKPPTTIRVLLLGGDWLQGAALRHYVDLLGVRPPDWVHHLRFYIVPIVSSSISRHLSSIDQSYHQMFGTENWHQLCERAANIESSLVKQDILELTNRIQRYLHTAGPCTQIPIAEAMVNYKDEDSCQIFVPFVSDVRIGNPEGPNLSVDLDETNSLLNSQPSSLLSSCQLMSGINSGPASNSTGLSSSPPLSGRNSPPMPMTPASHKDKEFQQLQQSIQQIQSSGQEPVELQIDYWPIIKPGDIKEKNVLKSGDQGKNSIKSSFRNLQVWRLPTNPQIGEITNGLTVTFATKEKKQKIMRLGKKKEKDRDQEKEQCVEGVSRLICSPKQSHPVPLRVYIDGTEWTGVKFFQLSSQWQTHVKNFPVALIGAPISLSDLT